MPYVADRAARLYYDDRCGPCRLLARAAEGMSGRRIRIAPLDAPTAESDLGVLPVDPRYSYAHLASGPSLLTGPAITTPLVGLTFGPRAEAVVRRLPPLERSIRWAYSRLWEHRRLHGCAAKALG